MTKLACAALLVSGAVACASPSGQRAVTADAVTQSPTSPTSFSAGSANVVISAPETTTAVRVGQTVGLKPFRDGVRWQVSFSDAALELLTAPDRLPEPGPDGWVWKALAPGLTEITLTSTVPCPAPPCAPNVQRFTITLDITLDITGSL